MSILGKNVHVGRRSDGTIELLRHNQAPYGVEDAGIPAATPDRLARAYLAAVASDYGLDADWLSAIDEPPGRTRREASRLRFRETKRIRGLRTKAYAQTYLGLTVWEAGVAVRMQADPLQVVSSQSTAHTSIDLRLGKAVAGLTVDKGVDKVDTELLDRVLAQSGKRARDRLTRMAAQARSKVRKVTSERSLIYRYDPAQRIDPEAEAEAEDHEGAPPILPLAAVPRAIEKGRHYLVTELLFTLEMPRRGEIHWRAFFEATTGAVLYLRAFIQSVGGMVFLADPVRQTGDTTLTPCSSAADLNPWRTDVVLSGLTPPGGTGPQALTGTYVRLSDTNFPDIAPPTESVGDDFDYSAVTDNFAAVNAYYHLDSLYRMVIDEFGFANYFDNTSFPVTVDHRGEAIGVNAHHYPDGTGCGTGKFTFGLLDLGCPVGYATDRSPVIHEFGHSCLQNNICSGTFSWAHGIGDSLAMILLDPGSQAPDRFVRSPFFSSGAATRRCDRDPADGWGWGGTHDTGSYSSTQILSTTLFRAYRSTGGDDQHGNDAVRLARRSFAARYMAYLVTGAVGTMTSAAPPAGPDDFATALIDFDQTSDDFEGHPGGAFHKVVRWAFEKQGLYSGNPPAVDVYIDDGRGGEFEWQQNFWNTTDIWNRTSPGHGHTHQTPILDQTNYMFVRVKNRGTETAENVVVRAYHCRPSTGLVWPDDWEAVDTAELPAGSIHSGGETVVGPFEWVPEVEGHECLLASVSADGDPSNADTVNGPIPHWRLVPFDNNLGQRNVAPEPGGDGDALVRSFTRRRFWVNNPYARTVQVEIDTLLPAVLRRRGWKIRFRNPGGHRFQLGPRASQEIVLQLEPGAGFSPADLPTVGADLDFHVSVDRLLVGGMTYRLDPGMTEPPRERRKDRGAGKDCLGPAAELLDCLGLPDDNVKSARLRKVTVEITYRDDEC